MRSSGAQLLKRKPGENGKKQFNFHAVRLVFFGFRLWVYCGSASLRKCGGLWREMFALHAGYVAERKHHGVQAALYRGGVGTAVLLQLHHLRRRGLTRAVCCSGLEATLPHL